jgi:hypothetical protein
MTASSARFIAVEHRRPDLFHDVLGAAHRMGRVHVHRVPGHEPVKQYPQSCEVLFQVGFASSRPSM